ncbi:MAG: ribonuclease R [Planctomycetaceae bacterium]|nr:ribonuclease R [Planctomycetaceae bacterium]
MTFEYEKVRSELLQLVESPKYKPMKPKSLLNALGLTGDDRRQLTQLLKDMTKDGVIEYGAEHRIFPASTSNTEKKSAEEPSSKRKKEKSNTKENVVGKFQRRPSGIGFVRPQFAQNDDIESDIFIPAHWTRDAASGDTVSVEIISRRPKDDYSNDDGEDDFGKPFRTKKRFADTEKEYPVTGRITEILERAYNRFVGTYSIKHLWGYIQVDASVFKKMIPIGDAASTPAREGDKIVVEMVKYPTPHNDGEAVIVEVLGQHGIPGIDTLMIMRQFDLPEQFDEKTLRAVRDEVKKFINLEDDWASKEAARVDLTDELIITIDPADAKDFDDAVSLEKLPNGNWKLGVHIADVSYFVQKGSPLDNEAKHRATSVYLPDRVIPMLPEVLSNSLASLQPDKMRFAKTVIMEFNPEGIRVDTQICNSAIKSKQRFNYKEVQDYFDNPKCGKEWRPEIRQLLSNLLELMQLLKQKRTERGSLEMGVPETKIQLDDDGNVAGAFIYPYYDSNRVIEECMLAANEAAADYLAAKGVLFLRRVHQGPSLRKLRSFADFVRALDIADIDANILFQDRFTLQQLLDSVKGTTQEYAVNLSLLRSMKKAVYSPEPEAHYALASTCYCHFTSPIRRYPDLTVHRLLDALLEGRSVKQEQRELVLLGEHCSDREQRAEKAERELIKLKLVDYMSKHIGENMEAIITGVEAFGVFVMGTEIPAEGLIRLEGIADDVYRFNGDMKILTGRRNDNTLRIGDRLLVEVVRADIDTRQIDFRLVKRLKQETPPAKLKKKKPKPKKKK